MRMHAGHLALAMALASGAANAATREIKDAVARVTVIPEARSDIKVEVTRNCLMVTSPCWTERLLLFRRVDNPFPYPFNYWNTYSISYSSISVAVQFSGKPCSFSYSEGSRRRTNDV